ncbi:MAG: hypothetical protein HY718_18875 [Planctomycetes bacterium]|nr:hypothetical protein [Planctomycetota bacterium]
MAKPIPATIGKLIVRCYAFVVMAVVVWAGYTAVIYLYRSVFKPGKPPAAMLDWQAHTRAQALRTPEAPGITEAALRSPLGHYHRVDRWFQPDLRNGCITSGCHDPIPHSKSKALRAFANLHATFMTCETCHKAPAGSPMPAVWIDIRTGDKQPPPAILLLMKHLGTTTQPAQDLAESSATTLRLLRQAIDVIGGDPVLGYLAVQLDTSEPGSPAWRQAMDQLKSELPNHARGEYGARISPATGGADPQPIRQDFNGLVEQYFSRANTQAQRDVISRKIHDGVNPAPQGCLPCHRGSPPMIDFAALGYPPERVRTLTHTPIADMLQQIHQGQPFSLPLGP